MYCVQQDCVLSGKYSSFLPYCYSNLEQDGLIGAIDTSDFGPYYNKGLYTRSLQLLQPLKICTDKGFMYKLTCSVKLQRNTTTPTTSQAGWSIPGSRVYPTLLVERTE